MALSVRYSIFNRFLIVAFCMILICALAPLALAQHPSGRIAGGGAHISAPPIYHVPSIYHAPISSAPVYHAPIYTPRISTTWSAGIPGSARFLPPRRPIRRFPPVFIVYWSPFIFGSPFSGFNCWWATCDLFWPWTVDYTTVSSSGPANYVSQAYEAPLLDYGQEGDYGQEAPDMPQLYLKDGTILNVSDYWLVDDQLHFTIIQEYGAKPEEEVVPFETLDLQKTVDVNTQKGFRFMLRNEPFEQYVRDHPEGPPPVLTPPHQ